MAKGTTVRMWHRSVVVLILLVVAGFGAIVFNLIKLQLVQGAALSTLAVDQQLKDTTLTAKRGTIYDCNLKVLAESATVWDVILEPAYINDQNRPVIVQGLSSILNIDAATVEQKSQGSTYYVRLASKVDSDTKDAILAFKEDKGITNGIRLVENYKRYYPFGAFAATVLGFTGTDSQGLAGIEAQYDSTLTGVDGKLVTAKNAVGTDMPFQYEQEVPAKDGDSLVLTIDEVVQHHLENNLEQGILDNVVQNRGCAIVMNVKTGAILAMAVKGDFDPNNPFTIADQSVADQINAMPDGEEKTAAKQAALAEQWRNKCVNDTYQPGSVFKMITASAALEDNLVTEDSPFYCSGSVDVAGTTIHCWKTSGHGAETFTQALCNSCNPVFIKLGQLLGPTRFFQYFQAFGFTEKTGVDLPGESASIYYTADQLNPVELATEAFGQSFSITPIQMITACAAVANGGYLVQPHLVSQILDSDGNIVQTASVSSKRQVISNETSKRLCALLQQDASTGTAKSGYVAGYRIAGKTGTSQKQEIKTSREYIASYCGFAPADDPQIALLVIFDQPHGDSYYGSAVAGPVFEKTMEEILPYLGIEPKYTDEELTKIDGTTPNVVGKTVDEATNALNSAGYKVKTYGEGSTVLSQVPEPNNSIPQGGTVVLFTDQASTAKTVTVPDLKGLSLSKANEVAAGAGLNISLSGAALTSNSVVSESQDISPGSQVPPGTVITVSFIEPNEVE